MKKVLFAALAAVVAMAATSCKKELPKAAFDYEIDGYEVSFNNMSKNADSYKWEFGDGQTSTETSPKHTYAAEGNYNVVLTATNKDGNAQYTETITIAKQGIVMNMDGDFADWQALIDDKCASLVEFKNDPTKEWDEQGLKAIWYYTDADNLYFYMTYVDGESDEEKNNSFAFYIDADGDPTTGKDRSGYWANIGAEYLVEFGDGDGAGGWNDWTVFNVWIYPEGENVGTYTNQQVAKGTKGTEKSVEGKIMLAYFSGHGSLSNVSRIGCRSCEPGWSKVGGLPAIYIIEGESTTQEAPALKFAN